MADSRGGKETTGLGVAEPAAWRGLVGALLKYAAARGALAEIEVHEAVAHVVRAVVHGAITAVLAFGAWALTVPALVWLVCNQKGWPLDVAFIITGAVHGVLALVFLKAMKNRLARARWFTETLEQFNKDRAWILKETEKR